MLKNVTVTLNSGKEKSVSLDYNPIELTEKLNEPNITMVCIGDLIINKHSIMIIEPTVTELPPVG